MAPSVGSQLLNSSSFTIDDTIQAAAASADARVIYFHVLAFNPPRLSVFADSNATTSADVENDALALRAFSQARLVRGTVSSGDSRYAEVAYPVFGGPILLLRASLHDSLRSINLVRSRLVVAGLIALAASLLVGYLAASVFARRIRRLERAADRIASGDFDEPVVDPGKDELGELAAAFERMRQRLAQLEHARREFVANASHELRTPLFSLGGFLELIDDGEVDAKTQSEFVSTMREQVARLTKLATELLDLSRLDAGRLAIEREAGRPRRARGDARGRVPGGRAFHRPPPHGRRRRSDADRARRRGARAADRADPRRERADPHAARHPGPGCGTARAGRVRPCSPSRTTARAFPPSTPARSSTASTAATARRPPAAGSASRSRASSPSG